VQPRLIYRTHYQVDEPALLEFVILRCTSPVESTYTERAAQRLSVFVSERREFNVSAAGYAMDLARGLGILNDNNIWSEKGHLLALFASIDPKRPIQDEYVLQPRERLTHFRLFLEGDGAVLMHILARAVQDARPIPGYPPEKAGERRDVQDWNRFAREMFLKIYRDYLSIMEDMSDRVAVRREIERLEGKPFNGKTGVHKCLIHLQALYRMGLLEKSEAQTQHAYAASDGLCDRLRAFGKHVPTLRALETLILRGTWAEAAAAAFHLGKGPQLTSTQVRALFVGFYRRVMATGIPLCSLTTLVDAIQVELLSTGARLMARDEILDDLKQLQKERIKDVRFHVDRQGRIAFVKMSNQLLSDLEGEASHVSATIG
jgi:hypothetical protein